MIPFVAIDETKIAPFHPFGVFVAIGFFTWDYILMRMAVRRGFDRADFRALTIWLGVAGWSISWLVDAVFYHPGQPLAQRLFAIQGFSSTGAIVGATIGAVAWSRISIRREEGRWRVARRAEPIALLPVSEVVLATWPLAWAIGRVGCALIHDHVGKSVAPGTLGSLLAVGFPRSLEDGVHHALGPLYLVTGGSDVRYDLGLLELAILAPLGIGFALTYKREVAMGTYTIVASLVYGPLRFFLDFLRAEDGPTGEARHAGLTFAQYWSVAVVALGLVLLVRQRAGRLGGLAAPGGDQEEQERHHHG